jgi:ATP-dependent Clp protease adaptor protein ClpS
MPGSGSDGLFDSDLLEDTEDDLQEPDMYRVLLHNDHYTTMDFVVEVLRKVFHKPLLEATKIMIDVHRKGVGIVGLYTFDIAHTKTKQVLAMAKSREFPLRCTFEKE